MRNSCRSLCKPVKDRPGDESNPSEARYTKKNKGVPTINDSFGIKRNKRVSRRRHVRFSSWRNSRGASSDAMMETRFSVRMNQKTKEPVKAERFFGKCFEEK